MTIQERYIQCREEPPGNDKCNNLTIQERYIQCREELQGLTNATT
jgi:hypothetical protein